jgi:hypothetical protein
LLVPLTRSDDQRGIRIQGGGIVEFRKKKTPHGESDYSKAERLRGMGPLAMMRKISWEVDIYFSQVSFRARKFSPRYLVGLRRSSPSGAALKLKSYLMATRFHFYTCRRRQVKMCCRWARLFCADDTRPWMMGPRRMRLSRSATKGL